MPDTKKKKIEECEPGAPLWMATFADMMTLLMSFFILIMSFSTMEVDKFKMAMGSLKGAFGVLGVQEKLRPEQSWFSPYQREALTKSILEYIESLREIVKESDLEDKVKIYAMGNEVIIQIKNSILFDLGKADLNPQFLQVLSKIMDVLADKAQEIRVEGHTDDLPIRTKQYPSNWELSFDRALNVVKFVVYKANIEPGKLSAAGFGEFNPLVPNSSTENRAKNRRVVIKFKLKDK